MRTIEDFRKSFEDSSSEFLLERRALGGELCDEAHRAIEIIFEERGEKLPPIPKKTILVGSDSSWGNSKFFGYIILIFTLIIGALLQESFKSILHDFYVAYPQASIVITVLTLAVASIFLWRRRTDHKSASPQKMEKLVEPEGLTELMTASEKGDIDRVQELLIYDPMTINKTSTNGATALMFAVRNNHELVVQYLLAHGADAEFKTTGGSTALSIAQRHKFDKIIKLLPNKGRDKTSMR